MATPTHCKRGHRFGEQNTYYEPRTGHRQCRQCRKAAEKRHKERGGIPAVRPTTADRFWAKVDKRGPVPAHSPKLGPCWLWTAATARGCGTFAAVAGSSVLAHVWAYQTEVGPVPQGLELDHLCFARHCVRPSHLEPVTHAENMRRLTARIEATPNPTRPPRTRQLKAHCPAGHSYEEWGYPDRPRVCRLCAREATRRFRARKGEPFIAPAPSERFWPRVDKNGPIPQACPHLGACWLWLGGASSDGYGAFSLNGQMLRAHQFAYMDLVGPIPQGLQLDHLCRVHACVNPAHLEPVTSRTNNLRGNGIAAQYARAAQCRNGHRYTEANTLIDYEGYRHCRQCDRDQKQRYDRRS